MFDMARFMTEGQEPKLLKDWTHAGLRCRVLQASHSINGYCAVPKNHPDFGKDYSDLDIDVHGGLTFGEQGGSDERWPDSNLFWFGFDTAHYFSGIWSEDQVARETERMAEQFASHIP